MTTRWMNSCEIMQNLEKVCLFVSCSNGLGLRGSHKMEDVEIKVELPIKPKKRIRALLAHKTNAKTSLM